MSLRQLRQPGKELSSQLSQREGGTIFPYFSITGTSFSGKKPGSTEVSTRRITRFSALKTPFALQEQNPRHPKSLLGI